MDPKLLKCIFFPPKNLKTSFLYIYRQFSMRISHKCLFNLKKLKTAINAVQSSIVIKETRLALFFNLMDATF
ncbi:hypothetical protein A2246_01380 [candidate division WOR-1 bacterium RIFOXYA2_FULL_37_7]|nr:MAG: hypothetical protein A2246_01380 [candidate division WOR-1 bacterium RIFOXYA2_FULL_37_7]